MVLDLCGKHALVCGGSEGIGRAAAIELAALGADITLLSRREHALREAVAALPCGAAQQHDFLIADVAHTVALREAVAMRVAQRPVHILVNNTGGPPGGAAHSADVAASRFSRNSGSVLDGRRLNHHDPQSTVRPSRRSWACAA